MYIFAMKLPARILLIGAWLATACQSNTTTMPVVQSMDASQAATLLDVSYGTDAQQKMDIYLPANRSRTTTPLIVLIHGGGWVEGDKVDLNDLVKGMQTFFPTYAIANINYQLNTSRKKNFPTQENDIQTAVAKVLAEADEYVFSSKVITMGFSAGAYLALMYAYKRPTAGVTIQAAISFVGPTDMKRLYIDTPSQEVRDLLPVMIGTLPDSHPSDYQYYSPATYATTTTCPTILFYGGKDDLVPASQGEILQTKLLSLNVTHQLTIYPNDGHAFSGDNYFDALSKSKTFLEKNIK
jgi:acetyl esterase/lipase